MRIAPEFPLSQGEIVIFVVRHIRVILSDFISISTEAAMMVQIFPTEIQRTFDKGKLHIYFPGEEVEVNWDGLEDTLRSYILDIVDKECKPDVNGEYHISVVGDIQNGPIFCISNIKPGDPDFERKFFVETVIVGEYKRRESLQVEPVEPGAIFQDPIPVTPYNIPTADIRLPSPFDLITTAYSQEPDDATGPADDQVIEVPDGTDDFPAPREQSIQELAFGLFDAFGTDAVCPFCLGQKDGCEVTHAIHREIFIQTILDVSPSFTGMRPIFRQIFVEVEKVEQDSDDFIKLFARKALDQISQFRSVISAMVDKDRLDVDCPICHADDDKFCAVSQAIHLVQQERGLVV